MRFDSSINNFSTSRPGQLNPLTQKTPEQKVTVSAPVRATSEKVSGWVNAARPSEMGKLYGPTAGLHRGGGVLKMTHQYKGKDVGKETVNRAPGLRLLVKTLTEKKQAVESEITNLKTSLATNKELVRRFSGSQNTVSSNLMKEIQLNESKLSEATEKLTRLEERIELALADKTAGKHGYFDSNYHRDRVGQLLKERGDGVVTASAYKEVVNQTNPGLIHARKEELTTPNGKEYGLLRLGVMTDLRNGAVELSELQAIAEGKEEIKKSVTDRIQNEQKKYEEGSAAWASLEMAIEELQNPQEAYNSRLEWMETQMLQYLTLQAERSQTALNGLVEGEEWNVVDVRLLNPEKNEMFKDSGWLHNEGIEMRDMQAIFKHFDGKKIICDGKGPFIDKEGQVHLPINIDNGKEVNLRATMLNVSVQGVMENTGIQYDINREAIDRLIGDQKLERNEDWKEALNLLAQGREDGGAVGESNATVAEKIVTSLVSSGFTVSTGCLSAKDRTGWVVARSMIKIMAEESGLKTPEDKKEMRMAMTKELTNEDSMMIQILKDVTGDRFIKLDPRTMGDEMPQSMKVKHTIGLASQHFRSKRKSIDSGSLSPTLKRNVSKLRSL